MLNSATLTAILVNILAALFFTCITICIATHFAKKKANEADKKLINNKCYGIIAVIFTIINFIASLTAIAVAYVADATDYYHISIPKFSYLSLVAGIIEFLVVKAIVFKKISCSKKERAKQAAIFAAICTPYYIIAANLPIIMYMVAVALDPC
jgi:uncharacterized BrkB/YihY/UPF0761 family membrane protein